MIVDPNRAVGMEAKLILCRAGQVELRDGTRIDAADVGADAGPFAEYLRSVDPNTQFLIALIPDRSDEPVYFRARDVSRQMGVHMQAPVETPEALERQWEDYRMLPEISRPAGSSDEGGAPGESEPRAGGEDVP